ncbi:MAG: hypothetical protein NTZ05_11480 [Chloroflexi bacterium]|nr:hypothetical protein [Chloroflexota bacterium]
MINPRKGKHVLVEGADLYFLLVALVDQLEMNDIHVVDAGGVTDFPSAIDALKSSPGFAEYVGSLGIIRDAEANPAASAFTSLQATLRTLDLPVPVTLGMAVAGPPRVNILILPDNNDEGMLETMLLRSIQDHPAISCVDNFVDCLTENELMPSNAPKVRVHAFLATQPNAYLKIGEAAQAKVWKWDSGAFEPLLNFLHSL